jgi:hypothetical protein
MSNSTGILIAVLCGGGLVLIFIGIGVYLIYYSRRVRRQAGSSQGWPGTEGQITRASIRHSLRSDSEGNSTDSYSPDVEYSYQVNGLHYAGEKIAFGATPSFSSDQKAQSTLSRYPVGGRVTVFYDPANPAESVLEKRSIGTNASLILGIIFLIVGLCLTCPAIFILLTGVFSTVTRSGP